MAIVNFYLKDKNATTETLIYLFFSFDGQRLKYSTGEKVKPTNWLADKQRVKSQAAGSMQINKWLNTLEEQALEIYRNARNKRENIIVEDVRNRLQLYRPKIAPASFLERFKEFIDAAAHTRSEGRIKAYRTTFEHLQKFVQNTKYTLSFETATQDFYDRFTQYLRFSITPEPTDNTIGKHISVVKTFLEYGLERAWHSRADFRKWKVETHAGNKPALTREEFILLRTYNLSANERLERVRDRFIFACYTGLRESDLSQLKAEHFQNDHIVFTSIKTQTVQHIPLAQPTKAILDKYHGMIPAISHQKYNDYLKELGKLVGLTRPYEKISYVSGKRKSKTLELWELLTAHVARVTFATIAQEAGMPPAHVRGVTGHSKPEMLDVYTRTTDKALQHSYGQFVDFVESL